MQIEIKKTIEIDDSIFDEAEQVQILGINSAGQYVVYTGEAVNTDRGTLIHIRAVEIKRLIKDRQIIEEILKKSKGNS